MAANSRSVARIVQTLLVVAADRREFDGILQHGQGKNKLGWPVMFSCSVERNGRRFLLVADGPGPVLAARAVKAAEGRERVDGVISTGFCGALDPDLRVGDIVVGTRVVSSDRRIAFEASQPLTSRHHVSGEVISMDRVAVTTADKQALRQQGGAVVEMEAAAVAGQARQWGTPFYCVRAVSDVAAETLPLDFNAFRDAQGRFRRARIVMAALARPWKVVPGLLRLDRNGRLAAAALGDFLADCRF